MSDVGRDKLGKEHPTPTSVGLQQLPLIVVISGNIPTPDVAVAEIDAPEMTTGLHRQVSL